MIISGDLDSAAPSDKDNELMRHSNDFGKLKRLVYSMMQQIQIYLTNLRKLFLPSIHFEGGRYEIELPWK